MKTLRIIDVPCPDCGAAAGTACYSRIRRGRSATTYHPKRRWRWFWRKNGAAVCSIAEMQALTPGEAARCYVESINQIWQFVKHARNAPDGFTIVADNADTGRWFLEMEASGVTR